MIFERHIINNENRYDTFLSNANIIELLEFIVRIFWTYLRTNHKDALKHAYGIIKYNSFSLQ